MTNAEIAAIAVQAAVLAEAFAPLAALLGVPGAQQSAAYLSALAGMTTAILEAVDSGKIVLSATALQTVKDAQADIQAKNDALAEAIASS